MVGDCAQAQRACLVWVALSRTEGKRGGEGTAYTCLTAPVQVPSPAL